MRKGMRIGYVWAGDYGVTHVSVTINSPDGVHEYDLNAPYGMPEACGLAFMAHYRPDFVVDDAQVIPGDEWIAGVAANTFAE